jgi:hypothetical protein
VNSSNIKLHHSSTKTKKELRAGTSAALAKKKTVNLLQLASVKERCCGRRLHPPIVMEGAEVNLLL